VIKAGLRARRSHEIADIGECLIIHPELLRVLEQSKTFLVRLMKDRGEVDLFLQMVDGQVEAAITGPLNAGASDIRLMETVSEWAHALNLCRISTRRNERDETETLLQPRPMIAHFSAMTVRLPPQAFLQPSSEGEAALSSAVLSMLEGVKGKTYADLFAGCGTFAGRMLERGSVHAYEFDRQAVAALTDARQSRLKIERRNLFTAPLSAKELKTFAAVVMDPPRAGAQAQATELAKSDVNTIVYVSCNPSTFAKDVKIMQAGGYKLKRLRVIDQFIWSPHTEVVGLLSR
jgi:23S rRNA (uracil1939-C5)-methyltransferase